ncbi:hypothetical protein M5C90_22640 [Pseudomonas chlororaphis subsp. piscium]|nr:hypothetical protein M5C90_22640 [Pseudomonas chlororaphis subsp. piscium]
MVTRLRWAAEKLFTGGDLSLAFLLWAYPVSGATFCRIAETGFRKQQSAFAVKRDQRQRNEKMSCGRPLAVSFGRGRCLAPALQVIAGKPRSYGEVMRVMGSS